MSLENKIDKKQWIPVVGLGKAVYNLVKKEPSVLNFYKHKSPLTVDSYIDILKNTAIFNVYICYQFFASALTLYGAEQLTKYFLK